MKIKQYEIVSSRLAGSLAREIEKRLAEGWQLYGNPFADNGALCQAMVKE